MLYLVSQIFMKAFEIGEKNAEKYRDIRNYVYIPIFSTCIDPIVLTLI